MENLAQTLGRNIRDNRLKRRRTQEDLSDQVGIHYTFLGHIERGTKLPSVPTLLRIAAALEVPPAALLKGASPGL